jgi:hypothetical protein
MPFLFAISIISAGVSLVLMPGAINPDFAVAAEIIPLMFAGSSTLAIVSGLAMES